MLTNKVVLWIIIFLCQFLVHSTVNYHQRIIYYGQDDNMCRVDSSDQLTITWYFSDMDSITKTTKSGCYCDRWYWYYVNQIQVLDSLSYFDCYDDPQRGHICDNAQFHQQRIDVKFPTQQLMFIVSKLTPTNPMRFNGKQYDCQILGEQKWDHFGPTPKFPIPTIKTKCTRKFGKDILID